MIVVDDIIKASNDIIKDDLILHRNMKVHPKFKVYKNFEYNLYSIKGGNKTLLFNHTFTENTPSNDILEVWEECDKKYLSVFLNWLINYHANTI